MTADTRSKRPPHVLARLWKKTSVMGQTYLAGRTGAARVLIMANRDRTDDDDATHVLLVAEAVGPKKGGV